MSKKRSPECWMLIDGSSCQSRLVKNEIPYLLWTIKRDVVDYHSLTCDQMLNHYGKTASFTTKVDGRAWAQSELGGPKGVVTYRLLPGTPPSPRIPHAHLPTRTSVPPSVSGYSQCHGRSLPREHGLSQTWVPSGIRFVWGCPLRCLMHCSLWRLDSA